MLRRARAIAVTSLVAVSVLLAQAVTPVNSPTTSSVVLSENPFSQIQSNRFTHIQSTAECPEGLTADGFTAVAENNNLTLYVRESSAAVRVLDKRSGYIWGTLETDMPDNLNESWSAFGNSLVSIEYFDDNGNFQKMGASDSGAECSFSYEENTVVCKVNFSSIDISLTARLKLEDDRIVYAVDDSSVKENGEYYLANLYFSPFLGSTLQDSVPGYMFVPDGSGALIRFDKSNDYLSGYKARVYGLDYAIDNLYEVNNLQAARPNDFTKDAETVSVPVYGIVHGVRRNAIFSIIENGAEYAAINAVPAGLSTDYNWSSAGFIYRQLYQQPITRSGAGIQVVQKKRNTVNPRLAVYFLSGVEADYVGMAHIYREYLTEKGKLAAASTDTPKIALDFIMADIQKGFFFSSTKTATTPEYLKSVIKRLDDLKISGYRLSLLGWEKGGLNGAAKNKTYQNTGFGSLSQLSELQKLIGDSGLLSLYVDPFRAKKPQLNEFRDAGISLSQSPIIEACEDESVFLGDTYFLKFPRALEKLAAQNTVFLNNGLPAPVIGGGNYLYGEYLSSGFVSRTKVKEQASEGLSKLSDGGNTALTVFSPNDYLFPSVGEYRNMPMSSSQYLYETDSVPFLQLVLSGHMTLYAPYSNESFYSDINVLKCIEYNCYPSFVLTENENSELKKTAINEKSSTCFDDWANRISDIYQKIVPVLSKVKDCEMTGHTVAAEGIIRVDYTGEVCIYVNYTGEDCVIAGETIPACSAIYTTRKAG